MAILAALMLSACGDAVTNRFPTLQKAKEQHAFDRGWLPPMMPDSATEIIESHNLDLNIGTGSFVYDLSERTSYVARLQQAGALLSRKNDSAMLVLTTNDSRWEIELPQDKGRAHYRTEPAPNQIVGRAPSQRAKACQ